MTAGKDRFAIYKVLAAAVLFSFGGVMTKWMPWSAISLVGIRALVAIGIMTAVRGSSKVHMSKSNVIASVCVMLTSVLFLLATKLTTAANAIVLQYAMPAIVIILCAVFYRQRPSRLDLIACVLVLAGVVLCFLDNFGRGNFAGDCLALGAAVTYAMVFFCARLPGCDVDDYSYFGNVLSALLAINLLFDPSVDFVWTHWLVAGLMGVTQSVGYLLLASGIKKADPVSSAIVCNVEPVLNPIWVFLVMGEKPGPTAFAGAAVVLGAVTVYSILSRKKKP